ncbi:MAG: hypothetical protein LBD41_03085 [Clostridiales Family XIII bacterium]|jgi:hypothetical protein|nr:hypothetical protein [Clostridiales Family XIII bacterium]
MTTFKEMLPIKSFYVILRESKIDIIKKTNLKPEEKEEVIEFIKKYGDSALKEFDWNKPKTIEYKKLKSSIDTWLKNRSLKNNNNPKIFNNENLFYFLHEDNEAWYYLPLDHDACLAANNYRKNADQSDNPDSPWCIGWDGDYQHWEDYVVDENIAFILQIKKNPTDNKDIKYMYQIYPEYLRKRVIEELGTYITFWDQNNEKEHPSKNEYINSHADEIHKLFFEKSDTPENRIKKFPKEDIEIFNALLKEDLFFGETSYSQRIDNFIKYRDNYKEFYYLPKKDKEFIINLDKIIKKDTNLSFIIYIPPYIQNLHKLKNMDEIDIKLLHIHKQQNESEWGEDDISIFFYSIKNLSYDDKLLYLDLIQKFKNNYIKNNLLLMNYQYKVDKFKNFSPLDFELIRYYYISDYLDKIYKLSDEEKKKLLRNKEASFKKE